MPTAERLAPGLITVTFTDPSASTEYALFGFHTAMSIQSPWALQTYLGPAEDTGGNVTVAPFATRKLQGPGQITLSGILVSTLSTSNSVCQQLDTLTDLVLEDTIYDEMELDIDYDFDDSTTTLYTLHNAKLVAVSYGAQGFTLTGQFTVQYAWATPGAL